MNLLSISQPYPGRPFQQPMPGYPAAPVSRASASKISAARPKQEGFNRLGITGIANRLFIIRADALPKNETSIQLESPGYKQTLYVAFDEDENGQSLPYRILTGITPPGMTPAPLGVALWAMGLRNVTPEQIVSDLTRVKNSPGSTKNRSDRVNGILKLLRESNTPKEQPVPKPAVLPPAPEVPLPPVPFVLPSVFPPAQNAAERIQRKRQREESDHHKGEPRSGSILLETKIESIPGMPPQQIKIPLNFSSTVKELKTDEGLPCEATTIAISCNETKKTYRIFPQLHPQDEDIFKQMAEQVGKEYLKQGELPASRVVVATKNMIYILEPVRLDA